MNLMLFFKEYMKNYEGLDDYLVEIDGQSMYEWNYEDGCLFVGASRLYKLTGDREYLDFIVKMVSPYIEEDGAIKSYHREEYNLSLIHIFCLNFRQRYSWLTKKVWAHAAWLKGWL